MDVNNVDLDTLKDYLTKLKLTTVIYKNTGKMIV